MVSSYGQPEPFFEILLRDHSSIFWRSRFIGHSVKLHDRPAPKVYFAQRVNHPRQVNLAASKFYPPVRTLGMVRILHRLHILNMQEEQAIRMLLNRLDWISATLEIMGNVELELHVTRIGCGQHALESVRVLAHGSHMIVIAEPDAEVGGALADLRQHSSQALVVGVCDRTVFRFLIQHLKLKAAYIVHEFCIGSMQ